jgi:Glutathione S-transferase, N-terminal domain
LTFQEQRRIISLIAPNFRIYLNLLFHTMASNYEVTYFDAKGRAEAIRVFLHAAGIEFKDTRMKRDEWPEIKPKTPLGFVPTLKINEVTYSQSSVSYLSLNRNTPKNH